MSDMTFKEPAPAPEQTSPKQDKPKGKRTRATAKEETQARRRRRSQSAQRGPLAIDTSALDPDYHYRFVEARPDRIAQVTKQDDYDVVENKGDHSSIASGTSVERPSGEHGMVLMRKPREFYEADRAEHHKREAATINRLKSGQRDVPREDGTNSYTREGWSSIQDS